jgi:hypothetical protein
LKLIEQVKSIRDLVNGQNAQVEEGLCSILDVLDTSSAQSPVVAQDSSSPTKAMKDEKERKSK